MTATEPGTSPSPPAQPPVAEVRPIERSLWGRTVVDDFAWLRNAEDESVVRHLQAENDYTETVLAHVAGLQERLFHEIKDRIKETDLSVPVRKDGWAYYSRTEEGLAYPVHCRRPVDPHALPSVGVSIDAPETGEDEVIVLDENVEAGDAAFFDVGPFDVSPDHQLLFWGWDTMGDERYTATIRDLATGDDVADRLEDISSSSAWALDNRTLFYVRPDTTNRPFQVWRHRLGTDQSADELIFSEDDERFFVGVGLDKDDTYIHIGVSSKVTDEVWVIPASDPEVEPRVIAPRRHGVEYSVTHHRDRFVIRTNDAGHENFIVMTAPEGDPSPANWVPIDTGDTHAAGEGLPSASTGPVMVSGIDVTDEHLVLFERAGGGTRIRVMRWDDGTIVEVDQPESVSTVWPGANPDIESTVLRYGYSSMVSPPSVFTVDLHDGTRNLLKQQEVLGGYDADRYRTERLWAEAPDGTAVPISLVWRADRPQRPGPCLLYAYGAYEASMDPTFSSARLSLLDRGFAFAIAHVRGGGEMGRRWYLDGKFGAKTNTFADLIACAEHLIHTGWTEPSALVVRGGSAGGLTVGATINRAPGLFAAAVAEVAFVDVVNTMVDPSLPLTVTEWEEWGNPLEDEEAYVAMTGYAPYENISAQPYPSVLATGGLHDTRVGFWEPAKWVQELRRNTTSDKPVLLWTDLGAGHGGPSGRYDAWMEEARILAYILWAVGLTT